MPRNPAIACSKTWQKVTHRSGLNPYQCDSPGRRGNTRPDPRNSSWKKTCDYKKIIVHVSDLPIGTATVDEGYKHMAHREKRRVSVHACTISYYIVVVTKVLYQHLSEREIKFQSPLKPQSQIKIEVQRL